MVFMETKAVSEDSYLDTLSENLYLNGFWEEFLLGGGGKIPPPWLLEHKKAWFW